MTRPTATRILQDLVRFDTTNPPGNERPCIEYIDRLLRDAGIETELMAADPKRPNLLARLPGRGKAPGLLLFGHVDVVTTRHQLWAVPPFEGRIQDGFLWGRGALDMKSGVAMMVHALLRLAGEDRPHSGDILFAAVVDEEAGGNAGSRFLANEHAELFDGIRYAIGEFGGFPLYVSQAPLYMIQVGEKQPCFTEIKLRGPAGHGARPMRDGAMAELGKLLVRLNHCRLPIHITPATERMVHAIANVLPAAKRAIFRRLLDPKRTDRILRRLGDIGRNLEPLFRNTANATLVRGGDKPNVIPPEISLGLDGRLLPGYGPRDLLSELETAVGMPLDATIRLFDEGSSDMDLGLLPLLSEVLAEAHPGSHAVPYLLPGSSDARFFARLGIQTYGFLPMNLPDGFDFFATIHAANERIPVESIEFGAQVLYDVLARYPGAGI
jgi:acetylornithine deacetylase/succinyl-diaminopimelate desuccinylase-like protein